MSMSSTSANEGLRSPSRLPFHYGWVIVGVGMIVSMSVLGMARFAFGMVLPSMRDDLGFSYGDMGWVGTGNFVGYLIGALLAGALTSRVGPRFAVTSALVLIVVALLLVSVVSAYVPVLALFTLAGVGSGLGNVAMVGMVSRWFMKSMRGWASGLVVAGIGLGLMISGVLVPAVNADQGAQGWRLSWRIMAGIIVVVALIALALLRDNPAKVGLTAAGHAVKDAVAPEPISESAQRRTTTVLGLVYSMYGFSYAIFATFVVTTLVDTVGLAESSAGWIWFIVGLLSLFCGFFGMLSDKLGRKRGIAIVFVMQGIAFLIAGFQLPGAWIYVSVALFGICAWSVPGIMGAAAGDFMPPEQAVKALGTMTLFFGAGQALGPAIAGVLGERTGEFSSAYLLAAAAAIIGAVGALTMKQPGEDHTSS